jgi:hypothetical protein
VGKLITHYDELKLDSFTAVYVSGGGSPYPTYTRLTHDKFPLCFLTYNRACFPSHWCYPWRIN